MKHPKSRRKTVTIRFEPAQLQLVKRGAKMAGMSLNAFVLQTMGHAARTVLQASDRPTLGEIAGRQLMHQQENAAAGE